VAANSLLYAARWHVRIMRGKTRLRLRASCSTCTRHSLTLCLTRASAILSWQRLRAAERKRRPFCLPTGAHGKPLHWLPCYRARRYAAALRIHGQQTTINVLQTERSATLPLARRRMLRKLRRRRRWRKRAGHQAVGDGGGRAAETVMEKPQTPARIRLFPTYPTPYMTGWMRA